jgi:hypothetical protein
MVFYDGRRSQISVFMKPSALAFSRTGAVHPTSRSFQVCRIMRGIWMIEFRLSLAEFSKRYLKPQKQSATTALENGSEGSHPPQTPGGENNVAAHVVLGLSKLRPG